MKNIIIAMLYFSMFLVTACSTKSPNLKNLDNGVVAIPVRATNTSRLDFGRYYKLYPHSDPNLIIQIHPQEGDYFIFSKEMPAGKYNFNRIKIILHGQVARSKKHLSIQALKGGIPFEIKPGSLTIAGEKLYIKQYDYSGDPSYGRGVDMDWRFETITDTEMQLLIEKIKKVDGVEHFKITNEM